MEMSAEIDKLAAALAAAQGKITGALKDSSNPFFKSKYADLASCWDAAREALSENGLSIVQTTVRGEPVTIEWESKDQETGEIREFKVQSLETVIQTMLLHSSGQWIRSSLPMVPRDITPQGIGSVITYGRRYGFAAMVGVAQVDDDGNQASGRNAPREGINPKGDLGKNVPVNKARDIAIQMVDIIDAPAEDGDHDETEKAKKALEFHERVLNPDEDLYVAVGEQLSASKRNVWKALVNKAKTVQAAERAQASLRR